MHGLRMSPTLKCATNIELSLEDCNLAMQIEQSHKPSIPTHKVPKPSLTRSACLKEQKSQDASGPSFGNIKYDSGPDTNLNCHPKLNASVSLKFYCFAAQFQSIISSSSICAYILILRGKKVKSCVLNRVEARTADQLGGPLFFLRINSDPKIEYANREVARY